MPQPPPERAEGRLPPFFIDDSLEVVRAVAADGIHVGKDDTPLAELMRQRPPVRVGYSVYNDAQRLRDAIACPLVDYVGVTVYADQGCGTFWLERCNKSLAGFPVGEPTQEGVMRKDLPGPP